MVASLVRSNERGALGFLKEAPRVNVLLSRARDGLILVGNSECLLKVCHDHDRACTCSLPLREPVTPRRIWKTGSYAT